MIPCSGEEKYRPKVTNHLWREALRDHTKNRSLKGHVLTGNECYTINIV